MEDKLYAWFLDQRERGCIVDANVFKAKAKDIFAKEYSTADKPNGFNASDGWFQNFKKRRGIRQLTVSGESLSADPLSIDPFLHSFRAKINEMGLSETQIYNADETGLFFRMLPNKTYVAANEKSAPGRKTRKERMTILFCANADGSHKVKPLVVGKSKNPRCFKNFQNPFAYDSSANAWMTANIFQKWFHECFVEEVREFCIKNNLPQKAILLVDNCSAHGKSTDLIQSADGNVIVLYLPPNVTSLVQPMDQNPLKLVKMKYRSKLLQRVVAEAESTIDDVLKKQTFKDAILILNEIWNDLSQSVLKNAWKKLMQWDDNQYDKEDLIPLNQLIPEPEYDVSLMEVRVLLQRLAPNSIVDISDIEDWNNDSINDEYMAIDDSSSDEEENASSISDDIVPNSDALNHVNGLLKWCSQNSTEGGSHVAGLTKLRMNITELLLKKSIKQTSINDFFKK